MADLKIKLIGVGDVGCDFIDSVKREHLPAVEYWGVSDCTALKTRHKKKSHSDNIEVANYAYYKKLVKKNKKRITDVVKDTDILILIAGLDRRMGSAATPYIADIARDNKILTLAVIFSPFVRNTRLSYNQCLKEIKEKSDTTVFIPCEDIKAVHQGFAYDKAVKAISTFLSQFVMPSLIQLDYNDAVAVLKDANNSFLSIGVGKGNDRVTEAVRNAVTCPITQRTIEGLNRIIINIEGGEDFSFDEVEDIANLVQGVVDKTARIIISLRVVHNETGEIKVNILATDSCDGTNKLKRNLLWINRLWKRKKLKKNKEKMTILKRI